MDGHAAHAGRTRPGWLEFLRACALLGMTGFGGGLAILAQAGDLFERRRWLTDREWLHTATVAQLIPGGAATNALAFAGLRFFGPWGALAAVYVYVAPAATLMILFGVGYGRVQDLPFLDELLAGFNGAVVGLVLAVTWRLGQGGLRRGWQAILAALSLALERLGHATVLEVIVLGILVGVAADPVQKRLRLRGQRRARTRADDEPGVAPGADPSEPPSRPPPRIPPAPGDRPADLGEPAAKGRGRPPGANLSLLAFLSPQRGPGPIARRWDAFGHWLAAHGIGTPIAIAMLFTFLRVGAVAYGGGFTIVPLLEREAVEQNAWITRREFADAIALGQVTPGPVLIAASFIGARAAGLAGGVLATVGVFAVPALLVIGAGPWLDRWRRTRTVKAALRGLVPAVVGMMAAAAFGLARAGIKDETAVVLAAVSFVGVAQFRLNPAAVVLVCGAVRVFLSVIANV